MAGGKRGNCEAVIEGLPALGFASAFARGGKEGGNSRGFASRFPMFLEGREPIAPAQHGHGGRVSGEAREDALHWHWVHKTHKVLPAWIFCSYPGT
jgi:hypothetical protein